MSIRNTMGLFCVAAMMLTVSTESQASVNTWKGTYNVGYNYGTGTLTLQEGVSPQYVDQVMGLVGTLVLKPTSGEQTTCTLAGPTSASVRSDRVLLRGDCRKGAVRFWYAFYLAKAPNAFHGYYTASTSPPTSNGVIGAVEQNFSELAFVASIWGQK